MIVDENILKAQNPSLERITVINFYKQNTNSDISNKDIQFLNAAGKMWVEVEQLCSLIQPSIKTTENKLVTILEGAIEIGSSDVTATFETGETFYIKKDSEIILVCGAGGQAALTGKTLLDMGYTNVSNVGAISDWENNGGPMTK